MSMNDKKISPTITVGRYAGKRIDQLPNSYLRWLIQQDFPKAWKDAAIEKLAQSKYSNEYLSISRHAYDMFSLRYMHLWNRTLHVKQASEHVGFGTFVATMAQEAWEKGEDVSKRRHQDDGICKQFQGIIWVFDVAPDFPDYKLVVTLMGEHEELSTDSA